MRMIKMGAIGFCLALSGMLFSAETDTGLAAGRNFIQNGLIRVEVGTGNERSGISVFFYDKEYEEYVPAWGLTDHGSGPVYEKLAGDRAEVTVARKEENRAVIEWRVCHTNQDGTVAELKYRASLEPGKYRAFFEPLERTAAGPNSLFYYYFSNQMDSFCTDGETVSSLDMRKPDGSLDCERKFKKYIGFFGRQKPFLNIFIGSLKGAGGNVSFYQGGGSKAFMFYRWSGDPFVLMTVPFDTAMSSDGEKVMQHIRSFIE